MIEFTYPQVIASLSGLIAGIVIGASAMTQTEVNVRENREIQLTSPSKYVYLRALAFGSIRTLFIAAMSIGVGLAILRLSGVGALSKDLRPVFALMFVAGAAAGKCARYLYWKRRARKK